MRDADMLWTDFGVRSQPQLAHHIEISPFVELPLDVTKAFSIDCIHMLSAGITHKMVRLLSGLLRPSLQKGGLASNQCLRHTCFRPQCTHEVISGMMFVNKEP